MKPLNHTNRVKQILIFSLYFGLTLLILSICGTFTLITAQKGISLLEQKKADYDAVFVTQTKLNFELDKLFRNLNDLKNKNRTASEHKQMQKLITTDRMLMQESINISDKEGHMERYALYTLILANIKDVQSTLDVYERESNRRLYNKEQLEKCRKKYEELTRQRSK